MDALKTRLWTTIHKSKFSVEELAFTLGVSPSYLARTALPGQSGCRFPLDLLLKLMHTTGDYRVLEFLASETQRVIITMRQVRAIKAADPAFIAQMNRTFHDAMAGTLACIETPSLPADELLHQLYKLMSDTAAMRRAIQTRRQREL